MVAATIRYRSEAETQRENDNEGKVMRNADILQCLLPLTLSEEIMLWHNKVNSISSDEQSVSGTRFYLALTNSEIEKRYSQPAEIT